MNLNLIPEEFPQYPDNNLHAESIIHGWLKLLYTKNTPKTGGLSNNYIDYIGLYNMRHFASAKLQCIKGNSW